MNNQIKEEDLTDAYLLGKYDGIKQGRADAIEEFKNALIEDLIKLKDKYFDLARRTTMPASYTYIKRMDTVKLIIEQIKLKS